MIRPKRLQLSRAKGFNLQEASRALNGLDAVNVARPSKWGNPHKVGVSLQRQPGGDFRRMTVEDAVAAYRDETLPYWMARTGLRGGLNIEELRGKNLACWCKLDAPCHADVLLELANR